MKPLLAGSRTPAVDVADSETAVRKSHCPLTEALSGHREQSRGHLSLPLLLQGGEQMAGAVDLLLMFTDGPS